MSVDKDSGFVFKSMFSAKKQSLSLVFGKYPFCGFFSLLTTTSKKKKKLVLFEYNRDPVVVVSRARVTHNDHWPCARIENAAVWRVLVSVSCCLGGPTVAARACDRRSRQQRQRQWRRRAPFHSLSLSHYFLPSPRAGAPPSTVIRLQKKKKDKLRCMYGYSEKIIFSAFFFLNWKQQIKKKKSCYVNRVKECKRVACFVNKLKTNKEFRVKTLMIERQVSSNYGMATYRGSEGRKRYLYPCTMFIIEFCVVKFVIWNFLFSIY